MAAPKTSQPPSYQEDVDFQALAITDPEFAEIYDGAHGKLDFHDSKTLQQLTKSLLKRDFGLVIELPDDRLCPPVPVRYNYVRWIQDLLESTTSTDDTVSEEQKITGLDIGIGASCIYSLLACSTRPSWTMLGTDIDSESFSTATRNITNNNFSSCINIMLNKPEDPLISPQAFELESLDFVMCNPPFYSSAEDMQASYESKSESPSAVCTGAEVEMICEGGDAGFVLRMVEESKTLKTNVRWYSSMLGKLSSVHKVIDHLKEIGINNWAVTLLRAGNKTRRWAVAWSFHDFRPRNDVARGSDVGNHILPPPTAQTIHVTGMTKQEAADTLNNTLKALDLHWKWMPETGTGLGTASANVWSRSARRKRKRIEMEQEDDQSNTNKDQFSGKDKDNGKAEVSLAFKIVLKDGEMEVLWLRGRDGILFESFCGMLKRAMKQR